MYAVVRVTWVYSEGKYIPLKVRKLSKAAGESGVLEFIKLIRSEKTNGGGIVEYWVTRVVSGSAKVGDKFSLRSFVQITLPEIVFPKIEVVKILE